MKLLAKNKPRDADSSVRAELDKYLWNLSRKLITVGTTNLEKLEQIVHHEYTQQVGAGSIVYLNQARTTALTAMRERAVELAPELVKNCEAATQGNDISQQLLDCERLRFAAPLAAGLLSAFFASADTHNLIAGIGSGLIGLGGAYGAIKYAERAIIKKIKPEIDAFQNAVGVAFYGQLHEANF